jgi:4-amino-4-deoxy-L-arabinose transferase-like glycosyltransferase
MKFTGRVLPFFLAVVVSGCCFFYKLGHFSYRIWDESRVVTNAYEMTQTGNVIVTTFEYQPDLWNTKPPFMIWCQALSIKCMGFNEFSARFPAALGAFFNALMLFVFVGRFTGSYWGGLVAAVILSTAVGPLEHHGFRFAEYDSLLTFFTAAASLCFFLFTEAVPDKKSRYMLLFFAAIALACLTKGIAGLLFLPAYFIYVVARRQLLPVLTNPSVYAGAALFIVVVAGYYLIRDHYNTGYIDSVFGNELGGRFLKVNEGHSQPFPFYFNNIRFSRFSGWYWIVPTALVVMLLPGGNASRKRLLCFSMLLSATFLLVISISETKLLWYDLPVYPLLAVAGAMVFIRISEAVANLAAGVPKNAVLALLLVVFSIMPLKEAWYIIENDIDDRRYGNFYAAAYCMRGDVLPMPKKYSYLYEGYQPHLWLYSFQMKQKGYEIKLVPFDSKHKFALNEIVLANQESVVKKVEDTLSMETIHNDKDVKIKRIIAYK